MATDLLTTKRAVLFDVGNTLVFPDWERIASLAEPLLGYRLERAPLQPLLARILDEADSDPEFVRRLHAQAVPANWHLRLLFQRLGVAGPGLDALAAGLEAAHAERHLWSEPNPDAIPLLRLLRRRGVRVAAVSNSEDGRVEALLASLGLDRYVELCVDSFVVGYSKPDGRIFAHATAALGVEAADAAFVGDTFVQDYTGARRAGLTALLYDPLGLHARRDAERVRSLEALARAG